MPDTNANQIEDQARAMMRLFFNEFRRDSSADDVKRLSKRLKNVGRFLDRCSPEKLIVIPAP